MPDVHGLLLDTHAWIWLNTGSGELTSASLERIDAEALRGQVYISVISVWELATLAAKGRITLRTSVREWVDDALSQPGIHLLPLSAAVAVESAALPGAMHADPADRILVASARLHRLVLLTRDKKILEYAGPGHLLAEPI
ncbi:MAG: type II toxin-antitoxin system VapC family toxin [Aphanocapsa lilacina HA4352-LM1]|jgi:PIN domain nuclease of toxin-antitoxin system|nr:type II toxin-antitoxin system VapC family toxin [Aphanocapsa lilacina HA4352-LM1]